MYPPTRPEYFFYKKIDKPARSYFDFKRSCNNKIKSHPDISESEYSKRMYDIIMKPANRYNSRMDTEGRECSKCKVYQTRDNYVKSSKYANHSSCKLCQKEYRDKIYLSKNQ